MRKQMFLILLLPVFLLAGCNGMQPAQGGQSTKYMDAGKEGENGMDLTLTNSFPAAERLRIKK